MGTHDLPDLIEVLTPLIDQCAPREQRILLAVLERLAGEHYRAWAQTLADEEQKHGFLECANREEQIAEAVEALDPQAKEIGDSLWKRFPNMRELYADTMRPLSHREQWQVQSLGELGGARFLRDFAEAEANADAREALLACAAKDEANGRYLEGILQGQ